MRIRHIPLKRLRQIKDDGYMGTNGFDYWDFRNDIDDRIWRLQDKIHEKELKQREEDEILYEFYHFELKDIEVITWIESNFKTLENDRFFDKNTI